MSIQARANVRVDGCISFEKLRTLAKEHHLSDLKYGFATEERDFGKFLIENCRFMGTYDSIQDFMSKNDLSTSIDEDGKDMIDEEEEEPISHFDPTMEQAEKAGYFFILNPQLNAYHVFSN